MKSQKIYEPKVLSLRNLKITKFNYCFLKRLFIKLLEWKLKLKIKKKVKANFKSSNSFNKKNKLHFNVMKTTTTS